MIDKKAIISVIKKSSKGEYFKAGCACKVQELLNIKHIIKGSYYLISLDLIRVFFLGEDFENHIKHLMLNSDYLDSDIFKLVCKRILNNAKKSSNNANRVE